MSNFKEHPIPSSNPVLHKGRDSFFILFAMKTFKRLFFKMLRLVAIFAILYLCLLLYMVVSERRYAFPRAQTDKASAESLEKNAVLCPTEDGKKLQGWILNDSAPNTVLYFPDAGEDASTFLSNAKRISDVRLVGFNFRGSAGSEGTPGEKFYESDLRSMVKCAGSPSPIFLGHGTGAIAAYNSFADGLGKKAVLVDPSESFGARLAERYRLFFPEFLSRTKTRMRFDSEKVRAAVVLDNPRKRELAQKLLTAHPEHFEVIERGGNSLLDILDSLFAE